jgi:hypothetical protein
MAWENVGTVARSKGKQIHCEPPRDVTSTLNATSNWKENVASVPGMMPGVQHKGEGGCGNKQGSSLTQLRKCYGVHWQYQRVVDAARRERQECKH